MTVTLSKLCANAETTYGNEITCRTKGPGQCCSMGTYY
jgi:hypothetical protein